MTRVMQLTVIRRKMEGKLGKSEDYGKIIHKIFLLLIRSVSTNVSTTVAGLLVDTQQKRMLYVKL